MVDCYDAAQPAVHGSPLLTQRSSAVCANARFLIPVLPRFCFVGCKESALPRPHRVWISTPCRRHSSSVCTRGW